MTNKMFNVIMVDDDKEDIFLTRTSFFKSGFSVNFSGLNSGAALFEYIKNNGIGSIDTLLLDINMPVMGGMEILSKLREYPHFDDITVFMFTTSILSKDCKRALELGATGYLVKPADLSEMGRLIDVIKENLKDSELALTG